jgi:hypothetical protein
MKWNKVLSLIQSHLSREQIYSMWFFDRPGYLDCDQRHLMNTVLVVGFLAVWLKEAAVAMWIKLTICVHVTCMRQEVLGQYL